MLSRRTGQKTVWQTKGFPKKRERDRLARWSLYARAPRRGRRAAHARGYGSAVWLSGIRQKEIQESEKKESPVASRVDQRQQYVHRTITRMIRAARMNGCLIIQTPLTPKPIDSFTIRSTADSSGRVVVRCYAPHESLVVRYRHFSSPVRSNTSSNIFV